MAEALVAEFGPQHNVAAALAAASLMAGMAAMQQH